MREARIAIVSKRIALSRLFGLEAERFGIEVTVYDKSEADLSGFDMCIIDLEGLRRMPSMLPPKVILINDGESENTEIDGGMIRLGYPVPLGVLDEIYAKLAFGMENNTPDMKKADAERIHAYREPANTVRYKERNIQLSDYEMKILERLCSNAGEPVSREELNLLLGAQKGNISDVYIYRLRQKLEAQNGTRIIFTVRSKGYKIITDMEWE